MAKKIALVLIGLTLVFVVTGCGGGGEEEGGEPTPNMTLTAVFAPGDGISPQGGKPTNGADEGGQQEATPTSAASEDDSGGGIGGQQSGGGTGGAPGDPTSLPTLIPVPTQTPLVLVFPMETPAAGTPPAAIPSIMAFHQEVVPQLDGDPGDWSAVWYALEYVVHGGGYRADNADLSAEAKLGWDQDFLYIGIVVRDTRYVQNETGSQIWRGDSIEMLIDTSALDDGIAALDEDDYQLGFSPGQPGEVIGYVPEAFVWAPAEYVGRLDRVVMAARMTEEGYLMEIAVPWFILGIVPEEEMHFGFLLSVSDNDDVNNDTQQSVISIAPERLLYDPTTWRDLVLQP